MNITHKHLTPLTEKQTEMYFSFYLLFHVVHPLIALGWYVNSAVTNIQTQRGKESAGPRCARADATHTCSPAQVHVRQGRRGSQGEDKRAVAEGKNERVRGGERPREGKRGPGTQKWYDVLIMTCPDIDGNAGAHVHTRSKTPCEGLR